MFGYGHQYTQDFEIFGLLLKGPENMRVTCSIDL